VILSASRGTSVVTAALLDALSAPFRAHEVRERQGIFRHIGLEVVAAKAAVREGFLYRHRSQQARNKIRSGFGTVMLTASQVLTRVVPGGACWQIRGHELISLVHHCSGTS
jgi:hypothetical protein